MPLKVGVGKENDLKWLSLQKQKVISALYIESEIVAMNPTERKKSIENNGHHFI